MAKHLQTGLLGEEIAIQYLESNAYLILERNWRFKRSEIDIIAMKSQELIFIEVKTRQNLSYGLPESFVSSKKERLIQEAAMQYMELINYEWEIRFDIISVILWADQVMRIDHIEDAFFPDF